MNTYNDLAVLKSRLDITSTGWDADLMATLIAASRQVDKYCKRFFYVDATTRYYDGCSTPFFIQDDVLTVTTLKLDEDGDATYESTMASTDYHLLPYNSLPKTWAEISTASNYGGFASGIMRGIEIAGTFGYGDGKSATPYTDAGTDINDASMNTTKITWAVDSGLAFAVGQTILCNSEQAYISAISTNNLTVSRAVNGTTAAAHSDDSDLYIYQYPEPIEEAVLIQAMRWWKRKDSAFQDAVTNRETGLTQVYKGLDADVRLIIEQYRRKNL